MSWVSRGGGMVKRWPRGQNFGRWVEACKSTDAGRLRLRNGHGPLSR